MKSSANNLLPKQSVLKLGKIDTCSNIHWRLQGYIHEFDRTSRPKIMKDLQKLNTTISSLDHIDRRQTPRLIIAEHTSLLSSILEHPPRSTMCSLGRCWNPPKYTQVGHVQWLPLAQMITSALKLPPIRRAASSKTMWVRAFLWGRVISSHPGLLRLAVENRAEWMWLMIARRHT